MLIGSLQRLQNPNLESVETNLQLYVLLCKTHFNIITHLRQYLSGDFSTYFFEDKRSPKLLRICRRSASTQQNKDFFFSL
jgi:hypothetical protein